MLLKSPFWGLQVAKAQISRKNRFTWCKQNKTNQNKHNKSNEQTNKKYKQILKTDVNKTNQNKHNKQTEQNKTKQTKQKYVGKRKDAA